MNHQPAKGARGAALRVLVVEDDYCIARDIARMIARLGCDVVGPAPGVEAAMNLLETERPAAAVLDIDLKGRAVYPLADALLQRGVPFVFITGYDERDIPIAYRGVRRLTKPCLTAALMAALPVIRR